VAEGMKEDKSSWLEFLRWLCGFRKFVPLRFREIVPVPPPAA